MRTLIDLSLSFSSSLLGIGKSDPSLMQVFTSSATRDTSNLLAHEAAFALGQMQDPEAIPALEVVLNDLSLHPIVRHEVLHFQSVCFYFIFISVYQASQFFMIKL